MYARESEEKVMKRKKVLHSTIVGYWLDKMINSRGEVKTIVEAAGTDYLPIIVDCGEPSCWACSYPINKVYERPTYFKRLKDDPTTVWNYECVKSTLDKVHIKPLVLSGDDSISNLFLLCSKCHKESPDHLNSQYFFKWVYDKQRNSLAGFDMRDLEKAKIIYEEITGKKSEDLKWEKVTMDFLDFNKANPHNLSFATSTTIAVLVEIFKMIE